MNGTRRNTKASRISRTCDAQTSIFSANLVPCLTYLTNPDISWAYRPIYSHEVFMNRKLFSILAMSVGLSLASIPALAHHGGTSLYDLEKTTTAKATITEFVWANPHCEISFDAADESGKVRHWTIEAHPPNILVTHGWTRKALNPGDTVTITFHPGKGGVLTGRLIKVVTADGRELDQD